MKAEKTKLFHHIKKNENGHRETKLNEPKLNVTNEKTNFRTFSFDFIFFSFSIELIRTAGMVFVSSIRHTRELCLYLDRARHLKNVKIYRNILYITLKSMEI